jgi:hypothetical protein
LAYKKLLSNHQLILDIFQILLVKKITKRIGIEPYL